MLSSELRFQRSQGHYNSLTENHNVSWKTEMWNKKVTLLNVLHLEIKVKNGSDGSFNQGSNGLLLSFCTGQTFYSFKYRCHVLSNWLWPVTSQMSCIISNCSSTYVFFFLDMVLPTSFKCWSNSWALCVSLKYSTPNECNLGC